MSFVCKTQRKACAQAQHVCWTISGSLRKWFTAFAGTCEDECVAAWRWPNGSEWHLPGHQSQCLMPNGAAKSVQHAQENQENTALTGCPSKSC